VGVLGVVDNSVLEDVVGVSVWVVEVGCTKEEVETVEETEVEVEVENEGSKS